MHARTAEQIVRFWYHDLVRTLFHQYHTGSERDGEAGP